MIKAIAVSWVTFSLLCAGGPCWASTLFVEDFESDLSQWNFPDPTLHGKSGANMSITSADVFQGAGSATFAHLVVAGNAFSDRIAVAAGELVRLGLAHQGPVGTNAGGWVGVSYFGGDSDAAYLREHWLMGPNPTMDFQSVGAIKADGSFDVAPFGPANNLVWDNAPGWRVYETSWVIPPGVNYLGVKLEGTPDVLFDDLRLERIPEPTSLAMACLLLTACLVGRPGGEPRR